MNWYLTKIVFRIVCSRGTQIAQFDEQLRLIQADTAEAALEKARQIAQQETALEPVAAESGVRWTFVNIPELYLLNGLIDGAELFSKVKEEADGSLYEEMIHRRAAMLRYNVENQILASF